METRRVPPLAPARDVLHKATYVRLSLLKTFYATSGEKGVHRLVVRMAAFQAADMGSNPVERISSLLDSVSYTLPHFV